MNTSTIDERSKWRFPIICSTQRPGVYFLTKWQDDKFVQVEATRGEVVEYNKGVMGGAVFLPEEQEEKGVII